MHRWRRALAAVVTTALLVAVSATTNVAQAGDSPPDGGLTAEDEGYLRDFLSDYGVAPDTQDDLIAKAEAGLLWDSVTGAVPESERRVVTLEAVQTVQVFADGSVAVMSREVPHNQRRLPGRTVTPNVNAVNVSCPKSGYGSYTNCRVGYNMGVIRYYFYANYTLANQAKISSVGSSGGHIIGVGASIDIPAPSLDRRYASDIPYAPARASLRPTICQGYVVNYCRTVVLSLYVYRGNAWTTY